MNFFYLRVISLVMMLLPGCLLSAQQLVNAYAEVQSVSGTTVTLGVVDETGDSFEAGEQVMLMQMQAEVVSNLTNTSSFGDINAIGAAGKFEILTISSVSESGGIPVSITLAASPSNAYTFNSNSAVQLITFPQLGSSSVYTTTNDMRAKAWNGTTGGVLCFQVQDELVLQHNLYADEAGFRGGVEYDQSATSNCDESTYVSNYTNSAYAEKGEGIHRLSGDSYRAARGKIANGGGGGNAHNSGGAGGGNYTAGGDGTYGWQCTANGGVGGLSLSGYYQNNRVFMGGGGGAGEANNGCGTDGGNGGGIIYVKANTLSTTGTSGLTVSANGENVGPTPGTGNDGAGGGGAGGVVYFNVNTFNVSSSAPLTVCANGGEGGTVNHNDTHGAGGGGGQGAVIYVVYEPTNNVTSETEAGTGGTGSQSSSAPSAGSGTGTNNDGVLDETDDTNFPVEWLYYEAVPKNGNALIRWATASENNNDYFNVMHSEDGENWQLLHQQKGAGNASEINEYQFVHRLESEAVQYYKIRQVDFNGEQDETDVFAFQARSFSELLTYPNPANEVIHIGFCKQFSGNVWLLNASGKTIKRIPVFGQNMLIINVSELKSGIYYFRIEDAENQEITTRKWIRK